MKGNNCANSEIDSPSDSALLVLSKPSTLEHVFCNTIDARKNGRARVQRRLLYDQLLPSANKKEEEEMFLSWVLLLKAQKERNKRERRDETWWPLFCSHFDFENRRSKTINTNEPKPERLKGSI